MFIGWPQLIWLGLVISGIVEAGMKHGKPKTGNYNGWVSFFAALISLGLLYWGGFFK